MILRGIDVSAWQGDINWHEVKADGIQFAILKAGGSDSGIYTDRKFHQNVIGIVDAGLQLGAYWFVGKHCTSAQAGLEDAKNFHRVIKPYMFGYPVFIDFEAPNNLNRQGNTDAVKAFCEYMESKGYYVGIYASDISGFKSRLYIEQLRPYDKWVARYGSSPKYVQNFGLWQYTSKGNISGIKGRVDMNYAYKNYPDIMIKNHLNGC